MTDLEELKFILRESDVPFFTDEQLNSMLSKYGLNAAAYKCLIMKSENTSLQVTGLTTQDTSKYFLRLSTLYKPNNSGILGGG